MDGGAGPVSIASFNTHGSVDGWGRPFDLTAAVAALDADVVVLQEAWTTEGQRGEAAAVAERLGYDLVEHPLATGRRARPDPQATARWMRRWGWLTNTHALFLTRKARVTGRATRTSRYAEAEPGHWGLALLSRRPLDGLRVLELEPLRLDPVRRAALVARVDVAGRPLAVVGTHMAHLTYGSPAHYRQLRRLLLDEVGDGPSVVAGDMNLWGPPLVGLLRGWHRAVVGPTWPAWRPHSQVDHLLWRDPGRSGLAVTAAAVLPAAGSDHRPVRIEVDRIGRPSTPEATEGAGSVTR